MAGSVDVGQLQASLSLDISRFVSALEAAKAQAIQFQEQVGSLNTTLGGASGQAPVSGAGADAAAAQTAATQELTQVRLQDVAAAQAEAEANEQVTTSGEAQTALLTDLVGARQADVAAVEEQVGANEALAASWQVDEELQAAILAGLREYATEGTIAAGVNEDLAASLAQVGAAGDADAEALAARTAALTEQQAMGLEVAQANAAAGQEQLDWDTRLTAADQARTAVLGESTSATAEAVTADQARASVLGEVTAQTNAATAAEEVRATAIASQVGSTEAATAASSAYATTEASVVAQIAASDASFADRLTTMRQLVGSTDAGREAIQQWLASEQQATTVTTEANAAVAAGVPATEAATAGNRAYEASAVELNDTLTIGIERQGALAAASGELAISNAQVGSSAAEAAAGENAYAGAQARAAVATGAASAANAANATSMGSLVSGFSIATAGQDAFGRSTQTTVRLLDDGQVAVNSTLTGIDSFGNRVTVAAQAQGTFAAATANANAAVQETADEFGLAAESGAGMAGMLGTMGPLIAGVAVAAAGFLSLDFAGKLQTDTVQLANFAQTGVGEAHAALDDLNHGFGLDVNSANEFADALAPLGGLLSQVSGGQISVADTANEATAAQSLEMATNQSLADSFQAILLVQRMFHDGTADAQTVANALYDSEIKDVQSSQQLEQAYGLVNAGLGELNPRLQDVKALVDAAAASGSDSSRVLNELVRGFAGLTSGSSTSQKALQEYNIAVTDGHGQMLSFQQVISNIVGTLAQYTPQARDAALASLLGATNGAEAWQTLLKLNGTYEAGQADVRTYASATDAAARSQETLKGDFDTVKATAADWITWVGGEATKALLEFAKAMDLVGEGIAHVASFVGEITNNAGWRQMGATMLVAAQDGVKFADSMMSNLDGVDTSVQKTTQHLQQLGPPISLMTGYIDQQTSAVQTATEAQNELNRANELASEATVAQIEGHTDLVPLLQREADLYRQASQETTKAAADQDIAAAEQVANQVRIQQALDTTNTKIGKDSVTADEQAGSALKSLTQAQNDYQTALDKFNNEQVSGTQVVTQAMIAADQARVDSARSAVQQDLAAWYAGIVQLQQAIASGNQEQIKLAQDTVDGLKSTYQTDTQNLTQAENDKTTAVRAFATEQKAEAEAVKAAAADELASFSDLESYVKTLASVIGEVPDSMAQGLAQSEANLQSAQAAILQIDQQLQGQLSADDRQTLENKKATLQDGLDAAKQAYSAEAQAASDMAKAKEDYDKAATDNHAQLLQMQMEQDRENAEAELSLTVDSLQNQMQVNIVSRKADADQLNAILGWEAGQVAYWTQVKIANDQAYEQTQVNIAQAQQDIETQKANIDVALANLEVTLAENTAQAQAQALGAVVTAMVGAATGSQDAWAAAYQAIATGSTSSAQGQIDAAAATAQAAVTAAQTQIAADNSTITANENLGQSYKNASADAQNNIDVTKQEASDLTNLVNAANSAAGAIQNLANAYVELHEAAGLPGSSSGSGSGSGGDPFGIAAESNAAQTRMDAARAMAASGQSTAQTLTQQTAQLSEQKSLLQQQLDAVNQGLGDQQAALGVMRDQTQSLQDQLSIDQESLTAAQERVTVLQSQNAVLNDQLQLSQDMLGASGQTNTTDPALLQLEVQRDQLAVTGQTSQVLNQEISQEQAKLQLAADQNALQNVSLERQIAQGKVAQDQAQTALDQAKSSLTVQEQGLVLAISAAKAQQDQAQQVYDTAKAQAEWTQAVKDTIKSLGDETSVLNAIKTVIGAGGSAAVQPGLASGASGGSVAPGSGTYANSPDLGIMGSGYYPTSAYASSPELGILGVANPLPPSVAPAGSVISPSGVVIAPGAAGAGTAGMAATAPTAATFNLVLPDVGTIANAVGDFVISAAAGNPGVAPS